jgi:hypothetical protein
MFLMHKQFVSTGKTALNNGKNWKLFYSVEPAIDHFIFRAFLHGLGRAVTVKKPLF